MGPMRVPFGTHSATTAKQQQSNQASKKDASKSNRKRRTNYGWSRPSKKKCSSAIESSTAMSSSEQSPSMSSKELKEWTKWYQSREMLEQYLRNQAEDPHGLLENFYGTLAHLMYHMFDSNFYDICYEELYSWAQQLNENDAFDFDQGNTLDLQLIDGQGNWHSYIYLAKSKFGGLGVFAAREFPKGALVGLYMGPRVWEANVVGSDAPTDDFLKSQGINPALCSCSIRDNRGRMVVVDPKRIEPTENPMPLYLGMHYMKGVEEPGVAAYHANCEILEDGQVVTHVALPAHTELICGVPG